MPKSSNQKLKLFYIADYLMRETDPQHSIYIKELQEWLESKGITAEYHSISADIKLLRDEFGMDIEGGGGRPFYLLSRHFEFEDISAIAECVGAAKFISEKDANRLTGTLQRLCSKHQAETINQDFFIAERPRQVQKNMLYSLGIIREAIKDNRKIEFLYTTHSIRNLSSSVYKRKGSKYKVSPFRVVLSEGNHYLVGFDDKYHRIMPYRIDRMEALSTSEEPREGEKQYKEISVSDYARQTFGMFIGPKAKRITLLCHIDLLDTMLERFGNSRSTEYKQVDDKHFTLTTAIVVSSMFYGWVCGLGGKAVILDADVAKDFQGYLETIRRQYEQVAEGLSTAAISTSQPRCAIL